MTGGEMQRFRSPKIGVSLKRGEERYGLSFAAIRIRAVLRDGQV
jgi:hypothetical protein